MNDQRKAQKEYEKKLADRFVRDLNRRCQANFVLSRDLREHPSWPDFEYSDTQRHKRLAIELTSLVRHDQIIRQIKRGLEFGRKLRQQIPNGSLTKTLILELPCEAELKDTLVSPLLARIKEIAPHLTRSSTFKEQEPFPYTLSQVSERDSENADYISRFAEQRNL